MKHTERIEREDLVLFINACLSATSQAEYYEDARGQSLALDFLHAYVCRHYRALYARTLAAGINDHARARIVATLLSKSEDATRAEREDEAPLVRATLRALPPQRAYRLLEGLCATRVCNRRARAVAREWLATRDLAFDAVKYRRALKTVVGHLHLRTEGELGRFLFERHTRDARYETPLFEAWRAAHYSAAAVYELPYTVAAGFARRHKIPRDEFLAGIAGKMTRNERFRQQREAQRSDVDLGAVDTAALGPTRLALYAYALSSTERASQRDALGEAMTRAVRRAREAAPLKLGHVVAVLDDSDSSRGSREKRLRPLAVTAAIDQLLRASATRYTALWNSADRDAHWLDLRPRGATRLAHRVLDALERGPELVVIVSDGYENDPPGALRATVDAYRKGIDPDRKVAFVHVNPVFEAERFGEAPFGPNVPMVSVRDAEDVVTALGFARFADNRSTLAELRAYLDGRVREFLSLEPEAAEEPS